MKYILWLLISICAMGCKNKHQLVCEHPFVYDEVLHYSIELNDSEVHNYYESTSGIIYPDSLQQPELYFNKDVFEIVLGNGLSKITDSGVISRLTSIGFKKVVVPIANSDVLDSIFCTWHSDVLVVASCEPVYRDILVFKKDKCVVGWIKVCFECTQSEFIGATEEFHDLNYLKLTNILNKELH